MAEFDKKFESKKQDWETPDEIFVPRMGKGNDNGR